MLRTIILLIVCLILLPFIALRYDTPLSIEHWEAVVFAVKIMLGVALTCFTVSEITRNCSQVDKIWSIIPIVYVWYFANAGDFNPRLVLMAVLVTLWGMRLTYNFSRRGAYSWLFWQGEEDYRWGELRKMPMLNNRINWAAFNLFFISLYQNSLILLFTLPIVVAWQGNETPLNLLDGIAIVLFLVFLILETIADQQQYDFQTEKYRRIKREEPLGLYAKGFVSTGLWARVRHPNYTCEQAIWLSYYLFSVAATERWVNWSLAGGILLILLFLGSSDFSEKLSSGKYPEYKDYQARVPRFIPKF